MIIRELANTKISKFAFIASSLPSPAAATWQFLKLFSATYRLRLGVSYDTGYTMVSMHSQGMLIVLILCLLPVTRVEAKSEACEVCTCFWRSGKKHIDCSYSDLTEIPAGINSWVYNLALQGNLIEDLGYTTTLGSTTLTGLKYLNLANNPITNVSSDFFNVAPNLYSLMLHHTELETLPSDAFSALTSLEWLWLNNNALTSLHSQTFQPLTELYELYLQDNALTAVPNKIFSKLKKLGHIYLHGNPMGTAAPSCCEVCGLPNRVDVKWGEVPQNTVLECGCGGDVCSDSDCYQLDLTAQTCDTYIFSGSARSYAWSLAISVGAVATASCFVVIL